MTKNVKALAFWREAWEVSLGKWSVSGKVKKTMMTLSYSTLSEPAGYIITSWPMRTIALIVLLLSLHGLALQQAQAQGTVKLSLASCEGYFLGESSFQRRIVEAEPERFLKDKSRESVDFLVLIENSSNRNVGIYRQWNSWGYFSIHFVVEGVDGKQTIIKKGVRAWSKNYPEGFSLPPGMTHAVPISLTSKEWKVSEALSMGARIKAVFQQEPLEEQFRSRVSGLSKVEVFTNKVESAFVVWETLTGRKAN